MEQQKLTDAEVRTLFEQSQEIEQPPAAKTVSQQLTQREVDELLEK